MLTQNCKTNIRANAGTTENIAIKFTILVKISLIGCKNLYRPQENM